IARPPPTPRPPQLKTNVGGVDKYNNNNNLTTVKAQDRQKDRPYARARVRETAMKRKRQSRWITPIDDSKQPQAPEHCEGCGRDDLPLCSSGGQPWWCWWCADAWAKGELITPKRQRRLFAA